MFAGEHQAAHPGFLGGAGDLVSVKVGRVEEFFRLVAVAPLLVSESVEAEVQKTVHLQIVPGELPLTRNSPMGSGGSAAEIVTAETSTAHKETTRCSHGILPLLMSTRRGLQFNPISGIVPEELQLSQCVPSRKRDSPLFLALNGLAPYSREVGNVTVVCHCLTRGKSSICIRVPSREAVRTVRKASFTAR